MKIRHKKTLVSTIIILAIIGGISTYLYYSHFWTYYNNFSIEEVELKEIVMDSNFIDGKTYMLKFRCKECNPEKRWMGKIPPYGDGITNRIQSIVVKDSINQNISSKLIGITQYNNIPLGLMYIGNLAVKATTDIDSLTNYINSLKEELCDYRYIKEDSSYYICALFHLNKEEHMPKEIIVNFGKRAFKEKISSKPQRENITCIIPKGQEDSYIGISMKYIWR